MSMSLIKKVSGNIFKNVKVYTPNKLSTQPSMTLSLKFVSDVKRLGALSNVKEQLTLI